MKTRKVAVVLLIVSLVLAAGSALSAAARNPKVLSLQAVVGGKSYNIKPADPIPTHAGETFVLTMTATTVDAAGKVTKGVAINTTFSVPGDPKKVTLASPTANGVTVTVHRVGPHGNLLKYSATAPAGYTITRGLAHGYVYLH